MREGRLKDAKPAYADASAAEESKGAKDLSDHLHDQEFEIVGVFKSPYDWMIC